MRKSGFKPFEFLQIVGIEANRTPEPMPVGRKVASVESIHSEMLSRIFVPALMRAIIKPALLNISANRPSLAKVSAKVVIAE